MGTVYIIKNDISEKVYIGSTNQKLNVRMNQHRSRSRKGVKRYELYNYMREIGEEHFHIEPLIESVPDERLYEEELRAIANYPNQEDLLNTVHGFPLQECYIIAIEYNNGKRIKEIARERGHCSKNVTAVLKHMGIEVLDWNEHQKIKVDESDLRRMYVDEMMSTPEIAKVYGTSPVTINKWLRRYDIPVRKAVNRKYLR